MRTLIIDERQLSHLYIGDKFNIPSFPVEILSQDVSARAGSVFTGKKIGTLDFDIPIVYQNVKNLNSKDVTDLLIKYFNHKDEVSIHIENEDWYWMGYVTGDFDFPLETQEFYPFTLKVKLLNPFKYSLAEFSNMAVKGQVAVNNEGAVDTYPVIEAKALKDTSHILIAKNNEDYIMLGEPPNANKTARKVSPIVLKDDLSNVTINWDYIAVSGTNFADNETGGVLGAYVSSIGSGLFIRDNKYPSAPNQWIGGGIKRALSRPVQDFEHKFTIKIYEQDLQVNKLGTGKVFTHLWDETGRLIASIGLVDNSYHSNDLTVIAKLWNEAGDIATIVKFKPKWDNYLDDFAYCSIKRVDNKWTFKINTVKKLRMTTKKDIAKYGQVREIPQNTYTKTYTDSYRQYMQPVRTASIYIARYDWESKTLEEKNEFKAGAYDIQTNELNTSKSNEVDQVIDAGDKIIIDNYNQTMMINKSNATKYKDFGSNYFGLESGQHELFIYPPDAFNVTVRWQSVDY